MGLEDDYSVILENLNETVNRYFLEFQDSETIVIKEQSYLVKLNQDQYGGRSISFTQENYSLGFTQNSEGKTILIHLGNNLENEFPNLWGFMVDLDLTGHNPAHDITLFVQNLDVASEDERQKINIMHLGKLNPSFGDNVGMFVYLPNYKIDLTPNGSFIGMEQITHDQVCKLLSIKNYVKRTRKIGEDNFEFNFHYQKKGYVYKWDVNYSAQYADYARLIEYMMSFPQELPYLITNVSHTVEKGNLGKK